MKVYIKGNYRKSIFSNDNGYVIGLFKVRDTNDDNMKDYINKTITFTGYFPDLNEDDTYFFYGEAVNHPKYGFQYQVNEYEKIKPQDKDGIIEFLSSDLFPGIGEKLATNIVEVLGEDTLDKIINDQSCLMLVPKITEKKANKIYDTLYKYEESHRMIIYLTELGFNMKDSLNIYNHYRDYTMTTIENNIYQIIDDIEDISFLKVDEIAKKMKVLPDDDRRIKAATLFIMKEITYNNGDTYLDYTTIYRQVTNYLKVEINSESFNNYIDELRYESKIIVENENYYLKEIWESETNVVNKIATLINKKPIKYKNMDNLLKSMEKGNGIIYNDKQKKAIIKSLENNILIITGGPGTGKTTIIKAITQLYQNLNKLDFDELVNQVSLLAPTGRAAKRMSESTLLPASTIHRFLKWNKDTNEFGVNEYNKDNSKLIIIDEVSMIDIVLLDNLFKGLTDDIKIVLVGDYNQLPSVGPGQVLKDLLESDLVEAIHLDLLYRQDENSYINTLAIEIKDNDLSETFLSPKDDYIFLECNGNSIRKNLKNLCQQIILKGYDEKRVQIMAPMYAGVNGIDNLNKELQVVFNPQDKEKNEINWGDVVFRENDKVLQLVNMPDENIFNGDIGIIKHIIPSSISNSSKNELHIDFDGNMVIYTPKDFIKIKHGYIISIHKSQGSEFELVIIPVCSSYNRMLYQKLIYTGITRAKKKLILIGEPNAFVYSVKNNNEYIRKTSLLTKLLNKFNN